MDSDSERADSVSEELVRINLFRTAIETKISIRSSSRSLSSSRKNRKNIKK